VNRKYEIDLRFRNSLREANGSRECAPDDRLRDKAIDISAHGGMDCFASAFARRATADKSLANDEPPFRNSDRLSAAKTHHWRGFHLVQPILRMQFRRERAARGWRWPL
jgi:hypothetical protein